MKSSLITVVTTSVLAFLTACGGGGASGDAPSQPGATKVAISSANQDKVVRASVNAGMAVSLTQNSTGGATTAGVASRAHALSTVLQRAVAASQDKRKNIASASAHPAAAMSDTQACGVSGTLTITLDDRDGNSILSNGDVITASFAQCKDSATSSVDGALSITLTGTPTDTHFTASASFQNVAVDDNGVQSTIAGNVTVSETDMASVIETTLSVGSGGLTASTSSASYNDAVTFAAGFVIKIDESASGTLSVTMAGTMTAQSVGGAITISTPQPLVQTSSDDYPSSGQVVITGAAGSALRATVVPNAQVKLDLDANGDGAYESTATVAWTTLSA